jgi:hypothetical protein
MGNQTNLKAIILRINTDHGIICSAAQEKRIVAGLNRLWASSEFTKMNVAAMISRLPTAFFKDNQIDSPQQYAGLVWDAVSVDATDLQPSRSTSIVNFNAPVKAQILQLGAHSKAIIRQKSQHKKQLYVAEIGKCLANIREAIDSDIVAEPERTEALKIISGAEQEVAKAKPDEGKIKKCLLALGKWSGGRFTKAVDTAIEVGVKYGLTGQP